MNDNRNNSIQEAVLEKIRSGAIHKRPRAYFILRLVAVVLVALLLLATVALVVSFIVFSVHESDEQFLLGFGTQGILVFLKLFPWIYAIFAVALALLLEWLLQGFKFGYRMPLLNIFLVIVVSSVASGILLSVTPLHTMLLRNADRDTLPIIGSLYEHIYDSHESQGVFRGTIASTSRNSFLMNCNDADRDRDDGIFTVDLPTDSAVPQVGNRVLVFGYPDSNHVITTNHIQVLPPSERK